MKKAIVGGKVFTITEGTLDVGTVFVEAGKVIGVEPGIEVPSDVEVLDASNKVVFPGIVDAHSHVGIWGDGTGWAGSDFNETSNPVTPFARAVDGINPQDSAFVDALHAGITTIMVGPGSANVIGGEWAVLKTVGSVVDEMVILEPAGLKLALGENPKKVFGSRNKAPVTRMGVAALVRQAFLDGRYYLEAQERAKQKDEPFRIDLQMEALGRTLRREQKAHIHAHQAEDVVTAVRLAEEFNLDLVVNHATEAYQVADYLAKKNVPCSVGPIMISRLKYEMRGQSVRNPGILARAGVKVAIHSDTTSASQFLPLAAGVAEREGMPTDAALRSITITAAEMADVADRVGSIEVGKDADIVIFSGHPFETRTAAEVVFVNGEMVYRREESIEG